MHPPVSTTIQGAYFVAACVTGILFGVVAVVFADVTEGLGCFLGGFCLSMWFLVLKPGGLITSTAGKAIFIACFTVGAFSLYVSHYTRPYGLIGSTSFAGATVVVLGVDMFSRAGLKEFWLYIWDLNEALFPLHYIGPYPMTRGIRVEIACTILLCLLGIMSQMKIWKIIKERREQRAADQRRREQEQDQAEEDLGRKLEEGNDRDRAMWDAIYGSKEKGKRSQLDSGVGTDEPSTRKTSVSLVDARDAPEEGMEMRNLPALANSPKQDGRITVHVAQDDFIVELPSFTDPQSIKSSPDSSKDQSTNGSQAGEFKHAASDASSVKTSTTAPKQDPRPPIDPNLTLQPKFVPLPFKVPDGTYQEDDDQSSVATFAASDNAPDRRSKRLSGLSLMRELSRRSKRKSAVTSSSEEALIIPYIQHDRSSSMAVTIDGVSIHGNSSREALSSRDDSSALPHSRVDTVALGADTFTTSVEKGLARSGLLGNPTPYTADSAPSAASLPDADHGTQSNAGLSGLRENDFNNAKAPERSQDIKSTRTSETEQQESPARLAGNLPEGGSKVVMAYRTNEWAKHLESAELPEVEDIKTSRANAASSSEATERSAPVNVRALRQTALTAEPAPIVTSVDKNIGDKAQLPSSNRSSSTNANNPYFKRHSPRQSPSATNINLLSRNMDRSPSQTSLSSSNSLEDHISRPSMPKPRLSQTSNPPARGFRSSSSPLAGTPLVESPIEEGVESSFPARFTPSSRHLMSQRDTIIRNRPSSTSLLGHSTSSPSLSRTSSANSSNTALPTAATLPHINEDDNIPLSHRKSLLQQQQQQQQQHAQRTTSGASTPYYAHASNPLPLARASSRISLSQNTRPQPLQRDSTISSWRASLAADPSNTVHVAQNAELEARRADLLAVKRRTRDSQLREQAARGQRRSIVDKQMRRGSMLDAHREAMRKMQGEVNKRMTNGASQ